MTMMMCRDYMKLLDDGLVTVDQAWNLACVIVEWWQTVSTQAPTMTGQDSCNPVSTTDVP